MKNLNSIVFLCILFLAKPSTAQPRFDLVRSFGQVGDRFYDVYLTDAERYVMCGEKRTGQYTNFWIVLADAEGDEAIFDINFGQEGGLQYLSSIIETDDGNFFAGGTDHSQNGGDVAGVLLNSNGEVLWSHRYGGERRDGCYAVIELKNGNFLMAGITNSFGNRDNGYLVQIDGNGDVIWENHYGGETSASFNAMRETDDGILLAGRFGGLGWLLKVDENGEELWSRIIEQDDILDIRGWFSDIISCPGGFLLTGTAYNYNQDFNQRNSNYWALRVNGRGDVIWNRLYDFGVRGWPGKNINSACRVPGNGFAMVGGFRELEGNRRSGGIIIRVEDSGELLWSRLLLRGADYSEPKRLSPA